MQTLGEQDAAEQQVGVCVSGIGRQASLQQRDGIISAYLEGELFPQESFVRKQSGLQKKIRPGCL